MHVIVTGGAGFIGSNYAWWLLERGHKVVVYDNFARKGCEKNVEWLKTNRNALNLEVVKGDVRDFEALLNASKGCDLIVHTAAQVSVPLSISEPRLDFESNATGTFNVLEVARKIETNPTVIYTSTNKVYGIPDVELVELEKRYDFKDLPNGVDESFALKGEEPYGVSKIAGDLYVRAYHLRYGVKSVSFRCSCMYGPRQWGKEEQGWVAWFCIAAATNQTINIFGNGKQVRDLLYVDDAIEAFSLAVDKIDNVAGQAINLGGGKENAVSLLEAIAYIEGVSGKRLSLRFTSWRPGDVKCYYTDYSKANRLLGWKPKVSWKEGILRTYRWVEEEFTYS
jgi:CDP-paratose 2-epimerase